LRAPYLVEIRVEAVSHDPALPRDRRRPVHEGLGEARADVRRRIHVGAEQLTRRGLRDREDRLDRSRGRREPIAQGAELAGRGLAEDGAHAQPLQIAYRRERLAEIAPGARVRHEELHLIKAPPDRGHIGERGEQPALERAGPGGRDGRVDDLEQRAFSGSIRGGDELEVRLRRLVEAQRS
jgi:hypothetical protein